MNSLPELVLSNVFSYLNLRELYRFRRVNKQWRYVIDAYSLAREKLCACHPCSPFIELFDYENVLTINDQIRDIYSGHFEFLFQAKIAEKLKELRLFSHRLYNDLFIADRINEFKNLKVIEIDLLTDNLSLDLAHLQTLSIRELLRDLVIDLNCPNLENFIILNTDNHVIRNKFPEKVKFLRCLLLNDHFSGLINLEHLIVLKPRISLERFKKLRRLEAFPSAKDLNAIERLKATNPDLETFVNGFKGGRFVDLNTYGDHTERFENSNFTLTLNGREISAIIENYSNLCAPIEWKTRITAYPALADAFNHSIPDGFFKYFTNIQQVNVCGQRVDSTNLISFLKKAKTVGRLLLTHCEMDQELFDQLPSVRSINDLHIVEKERQIDFEFLQKMQRLQAFDLCHFTLPLRHLRKAFEKLEHLESFHFEHVKRHMMHVRIFRNGHSIIVSLFPLQKTVMEGKEHCVTEAFDQLEQNDMLRQIFN